MKLLLTSGGIMNQTIVDALTELVGKQPKDIKIGFIPTAVDVDVGNKDWFVKQLTDLQKFGFIQIDIVEIAADGVDWRAKLSQVDVIYAGGGNPYYLLSVMRKIDFRDWLSQNLDSKVYVGGSSGAIVLSPSVGCIRIKSYHVLNVPGVQDLSGLNFVGFEIAPHVPDWASYQEAEDYAKTTKNPLYAIDDQTAIKVVNDKIEVVGEGKWKLYE